MLHTYTKSIHVCAATYRVQYHISPHYRALINFNLFLIQDLYLTHRAINEHWEGQRSHTPGSIDTHTHCCEWQWLRKLILHKSISHWSRYVFFAVVSPSVGAGDSLHWKPANITENTWAATSVPKQHMCFHGTLKSDGDALCPVVKNKCNPAGSSPLLIRWFRP